MRRLAAFLLLLLLGMTQPARADITAHYHLLGVIGPTLKIEVADNGDARVQMRHGTSMIRRGGIVYPVQRDAEGTYLVPEEDFRRHHRRIMEEDLPDLPAMPVADLEIIELGRETVGGRDGRIMSVLERGKTLSDAERQEMRGFATVISDDADLAPIGPLVGIFFGGDGFPEGSAGMAAMMAKTREINAQGAPIRIGWFLALERTSSERILANAFDLPGPIVTGEQAAIRLSR